MKAFVVDARTRNLKTFVASVTKTQHDPYQLVLRHALDIGKLRDLMNEAAAEVYLGCGETKRIKRFKAEMPVIIMGEYAALSSAGYSTVYSSKSCDEARYGHRKVLIVGGLGPQFGKKGLRILGVPIVGTLIRGPVEIEELAGAGNSNCASAEAALAGVKMLANIDRKSVFLVEGQSDYTYVVRLRSVAEDGMTTDFPAEHRAEMFSLENIVRRMVLSAAYHDVCGRDEDNKPSEKEVKKAAKLRMNRYLAAKAAGEKNCWGYLGLGFETMGRVYNLNYFFGLPEAIAKLADEFGVKASVYTTV